ncbi:MAG: hypothetical protein QOJ91_496 [Sphingomonadales bacterium]|jgi:hypothetical protein|nr:hypothetical protein [Sphingomonadales bacterium]
MMKNLAFCLPLVALAACADEPEPKLPTPDAALIERLAVANAAAPATPEKLAKADKLVGAVAYVGPDRVAGAAEKLLAR